MDPNSGKLFGAIGNVQPSEETPVFLAAGADPAFSRWYTLQWLTVHGFRESCAEADDVGQAEAAAP